MMERKKAALILLLSGFMIIFSSFFVVANNPGNDSDNVTVKVNITEAYPVIYSTVIQNGDASIELVPGDYLTVNCTVEAYDWNGYEDIEFVNATFWNSEYDTMHGVDDNSTHYSDTNCTETGNSGAYNGTWVCQFNVAYYALNGTDTWVCNATAKDFYGFTNHNFTHPNSANSANTTTINPLYSMNLTSVIDFGDAVTNEYIENKTCNITNWGNMPLNISVYGYDASNAMDCDIREIPYYSASGDPTLKYSADPSSTFAVGSTSINNTVRNITDFTVPVINDSTVNTVNAWHETFWHLWIPIIENPFGECNGTLTFTAWAG